MIEVLQGWELCISLGLLSVHLQTPLWDYMAEELKLLFEEVAFLYIQYQVGLSKFMENSVEMLNVLLWCLWVDDDIIDVEETDFPP